MRSQLSSGARWSLAVQIVTRIVSFVRVAILARFLRPDDFGVFAIVSTVIGFCVIVAESVVTVYITQQHTESATYLDSAFSFNLMLTLGLTILVIGLAPILAVFYAIPAVLPLLITLGLSFFLYLLSGVHLARLRLRFDFRAIGLTVTISQMALLSSSVTFAVLGLGVWAFALSTAIGFLVAALMLWLRSGWVPRTNYDLAQWRRIWRLGQPAAAASAVSYLLLNIDNAVVGKVLGPADLGQYSLAYNYGSLLPNTVGQASSETAVPALAALSSDITRFRQLFLKAGRLSALVIAPISCIFIVFAQQIFDLILGPQWAGAIMPFRILVVLGFFRAIYPDVFVLLGKPQFGFFLGLCTLAIAFLALITFASKGIVVVAAFMTVILAASHVIRILVSLRLMKLPLTVLGSELLPYCATSLFLLFYLAWSHSFAVESFGHLLFAVSGGVLVYILALRIFFRARFQEAGTWLLRFSGFGY